MQIAARIESSTGEQKQVFEVNSLIIAGWAGRDRAKMEAHIQELEALGVARPKAMPTYYRVAAARLNTDPAIQNTGDSSSGEAEAVLLEQDGRLYVGLGSDHTDRRVEAYGVTVSKQMCDKPIADTFWPLDEVVDHWDSLVLRSWAVIGAERVLYQDGSLADLLSPEALIRGCADAAGTLPDRTAMFCGTVPAIGGVRPAARFECELQDPVLSRRISLAYDVEVLPIKEDQP